MVNNNMTSCDMGVRDGSRCEHLVDVTTEDKVHFRTLIPGKLETDMEGKVVFKSDIKHHKIVRFGPSEIAYVDDVYGRGDREGVIGKVARANNCNAYSLGNTSFVRGQGHNGGFSIECTPFQVYDVMPVMLCL